MLDFSQIFEGWRNHLFPPAYLKEVIHKVSEERLAICKDCPFNSKFHKTLRFDEHCILCGCPLTAKSKCLSCGCTDNPPRWSAVVTEDEEDKMMGQ